MDELRAAFSDPHLLESTPAERTVLWERFRESMNPQVRLDSERGVDGAIVAGSAEVWNAEEFAPWVFRGLTVVAGTLALEDGMALGFAEVTGTLFVGDLRAGSLFVFGEVHCLGTIEVEQLVVATGGYVSAQAVRCRRAFGEILCDDVECEKRFASEAEALRARKTNREIRS